MQTWIYTIRHGQTDYNCEKRYAGQLDIPLNGVGYRDTIAASARLKTLGVSFDVVVASMLNRAAQTAALLVEDIPMVQCALCNERNYGKMQGLTSDEVKSLVPSVGYMNVGGEQHSLNPPGGETFEALRERAQQFHTYLLERYQGLKMLVVSHGVFLQQFHGMLLGKSQTESLAISVSSLTLTHFCFQGNQLLDHGTMNLSSVPQVSW